MLLEARNVHIPAGVEREVDLNELGCLSVLTRAQFGEAAVQAGDPDYGTDDAFTTASDVIANILHWLARETDGVDTEPASVIERALMQFEAERDA